MRSTDERLEALKNTSTTQVLKRKRIREAARKKSKGRGVDIDTTRLHELCESELVQVARIVGHPTVSRLLLKEDLIALILGDPDTVGDAMETQRSIIHEFVLSHPPNASALECDLHCPTCPVNMLVDCYNTNREIVEGD